MVGRQPVIKLPHMRDTWEELWKVRILFAFAMLIDWKMPSPSHASGFLLGGCQLGLERRSRPVWPRLLKTWSLQRILDYSSEHPTMRGLSCLGRERVLAI